MWQTIYNARMNRKKTFEEPAPSYENTKPARSKYKVISGVVLEVSSMACAAKLFSIYETISSSIISESISRDYKIGAAKVKLMYILS